LEAGSNLGAGDRLGRALTLLPIVGAVLGNLQVDRRVVRIGLGVLRLRDRQGDRSETIRLSDSVNSTNVASRKKMTSMRGMISMRAFFLPSPG